MGRRTKDADWLSDWTIVWKWRKVDTPSPVDSTDCCLNICRFTNIETTMLSNPQVLEQKATWILYQRQVKKDNGSRSGLRHVDAMQLGFDKFETWRSFRVLVIKRREGRKVKVMIGLASTMLSGKERFVWMSKTHLKIVRLDSFWIMEIKLQC